MAFASPLCRRPTVPVMPMAAAFHPIPAPRRWPGCGEQARILNSPPHQVLRRPRLQRRFHCHHQRQRRHHCQRPVPHRPATAAMIATAAATMDLLLQLRLQLRLQRQPQSPRRHQHQHLPSVAARLLPVATQIWTCQIRTSVRLPYSQGVRETQAIQRCINRRTLILS